MTLFLITKSDAVYRMPLDNALQNEISLLFQNQYLDFTRETEIVEFQGSYKTQKGELNQISDYDLPKPYQHALSNPSNIEILDLNNTQESPKALMASIDIDGSSIIIFHKVSTKNVLETAFSIWQSGDIFKKIDERVFTLDNKVVASYDGKDLLFNSFTQIRSFLPVDDYYEEATQSDLDDFVAVEEFAFTDEQRFRDGLSALSRKKIKQIQDNKIMENTTPKRIKKQSKKYNIDISFNDLGQVIFPKDVSQCKKIISFLNEEYATSVLTERKILMNSKQYLD